MKLNTLTRVLRWRAPASLVAILSLMGASQAFSEAVQIVLVPNSDGSVRVYIEHYDGDQSMPLDIAHSINITTTSLSGTQTLDVAASGTVNSTFAANLPGVNCGGVQVLAACQSHADQWRDWGYWDFSQGTSTDPISIVINHGNGIFKEFICKEGQTNIPLYSRTIPQPVIIDSESPVITTESSMIVEIGHEIPAAATTVEELVAQDIVAHDDVTPDVDLVISVVEESSGTCPLVITRTYSATDQCGNVSLPSVQTITVNSSLFAEDGILWHQPLARNGMSHDTDPSAGGTKYRFRLGSTIPIKIHAVDCHGNDVSGNSNVIGKVVVYGDTNIDGTVDSADAYGNGIVIDYNGVGGAGGLMDKVGKHLHYNLDTKLLKAIAVTNCYLLEVTVTDDSIPGSEIKEIILLQER